jgi:dephospho-CoA kinase
VTAGVRSLILGVTGTVASGKTVVAELMAERGAEVMELDEIGHRLLAENDIRAEVDRKFPEVQGVQSQEDLRRRLGEIVFGDARRLADLERILHERMCQVVRGRVAGLKEADESRVLVVSGAMLFEMGLDEICDFVVAVDAPIDVRTRRAIEARGWNEDETKRREARQLPAEVKRQRADRVIDNSGDYLELRAQVGTIWEEFTCP